MNMPPDENQNNYMAAAEYVGRIYRLNVLRTDTARISGDLYIHAQAYADNLSFISVVDRVLMECTENARHIIMHDYLMKSEPNWFLMYFSRSHYYVVRQKAAKEFINCLNLKL